MIRDTNGDAVKEWAAVPATRRRRRSGDETAATVAALWREQPNTAAIGGKLGISPRRVQRLLVEQGLIGGRNRAD